MTDIAEEGAFARTVVNSAEVLSHVWIQLDALRSVVDDKLPKAIERSEDGGISLGLRLSESLDGKEMDALKRVCVAWMWRYKLTRAPAGAGKGKRTTIGRLYFHVRLTPEADSDPGSDFSPYLAVHLIRENAEEYFDVGDLLDPKSWVEDEDHQELDRRFFPEASLGLFEGATSGVEGHWWASAYLPLNAINSKNIESGLIEPTVRLVKHCRRKWAED